MSAVHGPSSWCTPDVREGTLKLEPPLTVHDEAPFTLKPGALPRVVYCTQAFTLRRQPQFTLPPSDSSRCASSTAPLHAAPLHAAPLHAALLHAMPLRADALSDLTLFRALS
eukprot:328368-Rhodomonas_salina.1